MWQHEQKIDTKVRHRIFMAITACTSKTFQPKKKKPRKKMVKKTVCKRGSKRGTGKA